MKGINILLAAIFFFISCNHSKKNEPLTNPPITENPNVSSDTARFFPVTDYIKGQIVDIQRIGVNPIKFITEKNHTDSIWIKAEQLNTEFADFLTPVIDTSNLVALFTEKKFLDQTLDAYTFTYDPIKVLPDTFPLMRWDVYVNPNNSTVKRIYIVKKTRDKKIIQLTWQTNKWAKIVTLTDDANGNSSIEKEITLKWDFE